MEKELAPLQVKYKEVFGDLDCPLCNEPMDWDLHEKCPSLDLAICVSQQCDGDVIIIDESDIMDLKERADERNNSNSKE